MNNWLWITDCFSSMEIISWIINIQVAFFFLHEHAGLCWCSWNQIKLSAEHQGTSGPCRTHWVCTWEMKAVVAFSQRLRRSILRDWNIISGAQLLLCVPSDSIFFCLEIARAPEMGGICRFSSTVGSRTHIPLNVSTLRHILGTPCVTRVGFILPYLLDCCWREQVCERWWISGEVVDCNAA